MLRTIFRRVLKRIRLYGDLSKVDVARAIGRSHQVVWRWEETGQMPSREQEAILFKEAGITSRALLEILCEVLSDLFEDWAVVVVPKGQCGLRGPLVRAIEQYHAVAGELGASERNEIEEKLQQGRVLDAVTEQILSSVEKDVVLRIETALGERR